MRTVVVLVGCLAALLSSPPALADRASDRQAAGPKTVTRAYGDRAVRQDDPAQRVGVRFRGARGDLVRLAVPGIEECATVGLRRGSVRLTPNRAGYFRLRRQGWHEFMFRPCERAQSRHRLQLTMLRVTPVVVDAPGVEVDPERGYDDALRVQVPGNGMTLVRRVRGTGPLRAILPPTGPLVPVRSDGFGPDLRQPLFVRAGRPVEDVYGMHPRGTGDSGVPLAAGDGVLLFPSATSTWAAASPVPHGAVVDGDPVGLGTHGVPGRPQEMTFAGQEGQWVRLGDTLDEDDAWLADAHHELLAPDGSDVRPTLRGFWRLPADGTYRLTLTPHGRATGSSDVRLRSVPELPALADDGSPLDFAATEPGEWVVAPVAPLSEVAYELEATASTLSGPWVLALTPAPGMSCGRPPGPNGCDDWNGGSVSSDRALTTPWTMSLYEYVAVLMPAAEVQGQVTVTLRPQD